MGEDPMRSVRTLVSTAGAVALLAGVSGCGAAAAGATTAMRANNAGVWVNVNPATVNAGAAVSVEASCGDVANSATVKSAAFGTLTLQPQASVLIGQVTIPTTTRAGTATVTLTCQTGSTATTTLTILGLATAAPATIGPHTGGGFLANGGHDSDAGPAAWMIGGFGAIAAAGAIGVLSRRRRRTVPIGAGPPAEPASERRPV
jgi:hypothetical protein